MSHRKKKEEDSVVPQEAKLPVQKNQRVDLLGAVELLHRLLIPSLCEAVFKKVRTKEREGTWTLHALVQFWIAIRLKEPASIKQGVEKTRKSRGRDKIWPRVMAEVKAFYDRCYALRPDFFQKVFEAFIERLVPEAPALYASWMASLQEQFALVLVVDGSKFDAVAHRLKLLWNERGVVLPGCMTVFYDLFRGIPRRIFFYANAAESEFTRAMDCLDWIPKGTLLVGDRLYCSIQFFAALIAAEIHGVFRFNETVKPRKIKAIARQAKVLPEQISPAKLFPLLAEASARWAESQLMMREVRRSNPGVSLREPNWKTMKFAYARLGGIVVETRRGRRRKRRFCPARRRWKSIAHVPGGRKFLRLATVH